MGKLVRTANDLERKWLRRELESTTAIRNIEKSLTKTNTIILEYLANIQPYRNQASHLTTWFFDELQSEGTNNDLYYVRSTGKIYQFLNNDWVEIDDNLLVSSLAIANSEADTYDNKREVFYEEPIPPYEIGDVWLRGNEIYRCRANRSSGDYSSVDWIIQDDYTNDLVLLNTTAIVDDFKEEVKENYVTNSTFESDSNSILQKVDTKLTGYSTKGEMKYEIEQSASQVLGSTYIRAEIDTKLTDGSVTRVDTLMGTFDNNGLTIDRTGDNASPVKSNLDTDGLTILDKSTTTPTELMFAGYDSELEQTIMRVANMYITKYFNFDNKWRQEVVYDPTHGYGIAFYYIGG